jgi:hypothetical protein
MHHNAKLSDAQVAEMRSLREGRPDLWSYRALAEKFYCGDATVRDIVLYRTRSSTKTPIGANRMSYTKSAENRQAIIDHLHATHPKGAKGISVAIGLGRNTVEACVRMMTARGELEKIGAGQATRYKAIALTTISAADVVFEMQEKRSKAGVKAREKGETQTGRGIVEKPGFYRQAGGGWLAGEMRAEDRGQGSAGIRVSAGMFGLGGW